MNRKRIKLDDFDVHVPKGHEQIIDSDATTKYLFINGPKDIYTVYFDSTMPFYTDRIIKDYVEGCKLELKLNDRKISSIIQLIVLIKIMDYGILTLIFLMKTKK